VRPSGFDTFHQNGTLSFPFRLHLLIRDKSHIRIVRLAVRLLYLGPESGIVLLRRNFALDGRAHVVPKKLAPLWSYDLAALAKAVFKSSSTRKVIVVADIACSMMCYTVIQQ